MKRCCVILITVAVCWTCESPLVVFADPISECMETGRGTYMEGRWDLVPESGRLILCRDQETDRQKADRMMKAWQEEQRRLREEKAAEKAQAEKAQKEQGTKANGERTPQPTESRARGAENQAAPCARPDIVGECQATPDQILYQLRRSKETGGETNR